MTISSEALVNVLDPELFCNPVEKVHDTVTPITNPEAHLTCYDITAVGFSFGELLDIEIDNQLMPAVASQLRVATSRDLLCVPTVKRSWFGFPGSFKAKN